MANQNEQILAKLNGLLSESNAGDFFSAIREIVKAQGGFSDLARNTKLNRESLYKSLNGERSPSFSTVLNVLSALGLNIQVKIDKNKIEEELAGISGFEGAWLDLYLLSPNERLERADQAVAALNELSNSDAAN